MVEGNENDDVTLAFGLESSDPLSERKMKLMGPACYAQRLRVPRTTDDVKFPRLMSYLRFVVYSGTEVTLRHLIYSWNPSLSRYTT